MAERRICRFLAGILATSIVTSTAGAVVLVHDQFLETGTLATKIPMPGPGPAWNPGAQTGINAVAVVNTVASNNEVALLQTETTNSEDIADVFGNQPATGTTYARFDFRLPSADNTTLATDADISAEGLFFVTLRGDSASTEQRARTGFVLPAADGDFRLAINADNGNLVAGAIFPTDLDFDTTYRAVISFDDSTAKSKLWVNPLDESSTNVEHTGAGTSIGTVINRIILRQHNSYNGKQFVDNVVVATTFAEALNPPSAGVPGDYNGNGFVDAADYVLWRDGGPLSNEVDTPGTVNGADYTEWKARFGNPGSGSAGSLANVPEPATAFLVILLATLCTLRDHHRRTKSA